MDNPIQKLTQSKYYSPAFNAAIYDGPLRIYFAQSDESEALKVYFHLQQKILVDQPDSCTQMRDEGRNIFVMLYPNDEVFTSSFDARLGVDTPTIVCEKMGTDFVIGVRGPLNDEQYPLIYDRFSKSLGTGTVERVLSFI
jgi:hypothetical protein